MPNAKKSFMGSVKVSAKIAQKHALIKKRELTELKAVHAKLGDYAFQNQIGRDQLTEQFAAIESLDAEVQKKRTHDAVADTATVADKAKHVGTVAKDRAAVESLLLRRKGLIAELGRALCGYEVEDETITGLQQEAQALQSDIDKLKAEASELEQGVSGIAKKPFLAGAIAVIGLIVIIGALAGLKSSCSRSGQIKRATREAHQVAADINREAASMQKEMLDLEMQMKKEQLEEAERRKLQQAKSELERKQRELELQRERAEREEKRLAADLERKQEAEEREQQKAIASQERHEADKRQRIQEQADRKELAHTLFGSIALTPPFYPSKTVAASGAKMEVRGKNWDSIKALHQKGDWLALMNLLLGQSYDEYPEVRQVESAVRKLKDYDLYILCRTTLRESRGQELWLLTLPISNYEVVDGSGSWKAHPDGIGYTHEWSPSHGGGIVLFGDYYNQYGGQVRKINDAFRKGKSALDEKLKLGEISSATHGERLAELLNKCYTAAVTWARRQ
jgi:hypothetical protein